MANKEDNLVMGGENMTGDERLIKRMDKGVNVEMLELKQMLINEIKYKIQRSSLTCENIKDLCIAYNMLQGERKDEFEIVDDE